jgi:hypothetical protein
MNHLSNPDMKTDVLLYVSNSGSKSRITLDFVDKFFRGIGDELNSPSTQDFISKAKIPNEREIYGLLVKALLGVGGDSDIGHVATEIQVSRIMGEADNDRSTGRVDLLVTFRNTMFLMEVKVIRASINSNGAESGARSKSEKAWRDAVNQLRSIAGDEIAHHHNRPVVKLPLLVCIYYDGRQLQDSTRALSETYEDIVEILESSHPQPASFEWNSVFEAPIETYRRHSNSQNKDKKVLLHGFSLFAATVD